MIYYYNLYLLNAPDHFPFDLLCLHFPVSVFFPSINYFLLLSLRYNLEQLSLLFSLYVYLLFQCPFNCNTRQQACLTHKPTNCEGLYGILMNEIYDLKSSICQILACTQITLGSCKMQILIQ